MKSAQILESLMLAQASSPGQAQPSPFGMLVPIILMGVIFYFMLIRPNRMRQKEHQERMNKMKAGVSVVTAGGIHGKVAEVSESTVVVEVGSRTRLVVDKSSILRIKQPETGGK